ncbi:GNAT family N-acetyltransferase [Streptomyces sp. NPDC016309]|uniref:GNAT family N-acetyltransferase n=1 Tax=Streptomyces sp. NPDC016309 TaxID=3364965 RepID=UPI0036F7E872
MDITVIAPDELGAAESAAWRAMQEATPVLESPFLSPEFAQAVGNWRRGARVAVLSEAAGPVGFFPFECRPFGLGLPIGSGVCDCQGLIHDPGLEWDPVGLLRSCRLTLWRYDHLTQEQTPFETGVELRTGSPVIDIWRGFDAYLSALAWSANRTKRLRRAERQLSDQVGDVRFVFDDHSPGSLEAFMRNKSAHYRAKGQVDLFSRPGTVALLRELRSTKAATCTGILSVLYAGDRPIAWLFGLRSRRLMHDWFSTYDPAAAHFSPGMLLRMKVAEAAASAGIERIDLGKGTEPFKNTIKTSDVPLAEGWVERPTVAAKARRAQMEAVTRLRSAATRRPVMRRAALKALDTLPRLQRVVSR